MRAIRACVNHVRVTYRSTGSGNCGQRKGKGMLEEGVHSAGAIPAGGERCRVMWGNGSTGSPTI